MFTVTIFNQNGMIDQATFHGEKNAMDLFDSYQREAFKAACERCNVLNAELDFFEVTCQENNCQLLGGGYIEQRFYTVISEDGIEYRGSWAVQLSYLPSHLGK